MANRTWLTDLGHTWFLRTNFGQIFQHRHTFECYFWFAFLLLIFETTVHKTYLSEILQFFLFQTHRSTSNKKQRPYISGPIDKIHHKSTINEVVFIEYKYHKQTTPLQYNINQTIVFLLISYTLAYDHLSSASSGKRARNNKPSTIHSNKINVKMICCWTW